jgi:tetratricopeptide (TPR) repeat protein
LGLPDPLGDGRRAFAEGRHAEALFCFGQLLEVEPRHPWAWHGRGDALQLLGQHEEARSAYARAAELAPLVGIHCAGLSNALQALGRTAEAQAAWQQALRLDPSLTWMRPDAAR